MVEPSQVDVNTVDLDRPLTPAQVSVAKVVVFPPEVFRVVNRRLASAWNGRSATVYLGDLYADLEAENAEYTKAVALKNNWMDFEDAYRAVGWDVVYDRPGYNENYRAYFVFTKKK